MEVKTAEDLIFRAISEIRKEQQAARSVVLHLTTNKGLGLVTQLALNTVDKLIENQSILIKKHKGKDSFFVSKDITDCGQVEGSDEIGEITSPKPKPHEHNNLQIGNNTSIFPPRKNR